MLLSIVLAGVSFYLLLLRLNDVLSNPGQRLPNPSTPSSASSSTSTSSTVKKAVFAAAAVAVTVVWVVTGHWVCLDALGAGLAVFMVCTLRLPNAKVATTLFAGLLLYDVWWVFGSKHVFESNVMVVS